MPKPKCSDTDCLQQGKKWVPELGSWLCWGHWKEWIQKKGGA